MSFYGDLKKPIWSEAIDIIYNVWAREEFEDYKNTKKELLDAVESCDIPKVLTEWTILDEYNHFIVHDKVRDAYKEGLITKEQYLKVSNYIYYDTRELLYEIIPKKLKEVCCRY